jgi:hypothetical protein
MGLSATAQRWRWLLPALLLVGVPAEAADGKPARAVVPRPPADALLKVEDWQKTPLQPVRAEEIDQLLEQSLRQLPVEQPGSHTRLTQQTTDEEFVRRLYLDVTGRLPTPVEQEHFAADREADKRARLIDRLLDSDDYARHWGHYWTDVVSSRVSPIMQRLAPVFEEWLVEQLKENRGWDGIVQDILTADSVLVDNVPRPPDVPRYIRQPRNGAAFFIATRYYEKTREEGAIDLAAETARIFLGIQLQCAQCHDHPFDQWRREQFHQLAAFFYRSGGRPRDAKDTATQGALGSFALVYYPDGEYEMPDEKAPQEKLLAHPVFLDGRGPGEKLDDPRRRQALADYLVDKNNYWFAAAHVNRVWGELMGQAFYQPVDDMGPQRDAVFREVLTRLSGAFRATNYDVKKLFRVLLNTRAYQRQFRLGGTPEQQLPFAASVPAPLRAPVLWQVLVRALAPDGHLPGSSDDEKRFRADVLTEFAADPSSRREAGLSQALMLMNCWFVNSRIQAVRSNLLVGVLKEYPQDDEALRVVYRRTLGRQPTDRELARCRNYIAKVGKRTEAFEDILWALVNSAEFQTKR